MTWSAIGNLQNSLLMSWHPMIVFQMYEPRASVQSTLALGYFQLHPRFYWLDLQRKLVKRAHYQVLLHTCECFS